MNLQNSIIIALRALQRNKMRTALTSIGIIIGVSSVIIMVGLGNSARISVREKIHSFGTNAISMFVFKKPFTIQELESMKRDIQEIQYMTPMNYFEFPVKYKNKNLIQQVFGVNNEYFNINDWSLETGSYFTLNEVRSFEKVVIIGSTIRKKLFDGEDPIGRVILINYIPFKVIGVLEEKGMAISGRDMDSIVIGPFTTMSVKLFGVDKIYSAVVSTYSETQIEDTKNKIIEYVKIQHGLTTEADMQDLRIMTSKQALSMAEQITGILTTLLGGIASISLFVGGIGIMNIMLVSVSERTREIGIRMAIGAKNRDIMMQFLVESILITSIGGTIGILLGVLLYLLIALASKQPFIFSMISVIVSFLFATLVGVIFGYYPAKKASNLNPIDALRHE